MTLTQILAAVAQNIARTDKEDVARTGVTLAIQEMYKLHEFRSTRITADTVVTAETGHIALPDSWLNIYEVRIMNGLQSYPLRVKNRELVLRDFPDADTLSASYPIYCYIEGDQLYLTPRTSLDVTIRLTYSIIPTFSADDQELSPAIASVDLYLIAFATSWVFMSLQLFREAGMWMQQAMSGLQTAISSDEEIMADDMIKEAVEISSHIARDPTDPFFGLNDTNTVIPPGGPYGT